MFIPDSPIAKEQEDELNRKGFAKNLAETIRDWDRKESIVVGLFGPWGSGKTSILNLACNHIEQTTHNWEKDKRPIIVHFNPWTYSAQDILLKAFLQQVFSAVNIRLPVHKKDFQKQINGLARTLGAFEKVPIAGPWIAVTGKTIDLINPQETLETLRKKIDEYFQNLTCRLIIVIDDIDRLTQTEIRQLFQIIKINADFPNTIYLVAFDRKVVEDALKTEQSVSGRVYLEKIIQVGFDIPQIEQAYVEQYFFNKLNKILSEINPEFWDKTRWANLYYAGIKEFLITMRDAKRLINSLEFNLKIISGEINAIDFIGIEVLRVFLPEVYEGIASGKTLFASYGERYPNQNDLQDNKSQLDKIFKKAGEREETARRIALQLFPQIASAYKKPSYGPEWQRIWRKEGKICAADMFDRYFILGIPKGEISHQELREIIDISNEPERLILLLRQYYEQERLVGLLTWLEDVLDRLNDKGILGLCETLFKFGDEIPDIHQGIYDFGTDLQIYRLIHIALPRITDKDMRCSWVFDQILNGPSIFTIIHYVSNEIPKKDGILNQDLLFDEECIKKLTVACAEKITVEAESGRLIQAKRLPYLLFRWREWSKDQELISSWVKKMTEDTISALEFLSGFLWQGSSYVFGDYVSTTELQIDIKSLKEFIDINELLKILSQLSENDLTQLSERNRIAMVTFIKDMREQPTELG
jgi:GTPase SAR1 family protein